MPRAMTSAAHPAARSAVEWARTDAAVAAWALLPIAVWDWSQLDITVSRMLGNATGFPWRDHWLLSQVLHSGTRNLAWVLVLALAFSLWKPWGPLRALDRGTRAWWLVTTLTCAAVIPLIKRMSQTTCPWSLTEFGGEAGVYVPHWMLGISDGGEGGCFPSGHASTAFAFFAAWFALRNQAPAAARLWLTAVVLVGLVLGAVQVVRGAHFVSHPLWTAWICWVTCAGSSLAFAAWRERGQPT
jgi:membrane-associated PAP2 superfamily phosphatase